MENKVERLLKKIAESNPKIGEIEKDFPDPARSFGPSALAITKMSAAAKLLRPYWKKGIGPHDLPEIDRMMKALNIIPKKLLDYIEDIGYSSKTSRGSYQWKMGGFPATIALPLEPKMPSSDRFMPTAHILFHELGHAAEDFAKTEAGFIPETAWELIKKAAPKLEGGADWYAQQLAAKTGTPFMPSSLARPFHGLPSTTQRGYEGMEAVTRSLPQTVVSDPFKVVAEFMKNIMATYNIK